MSFKDGLTSPVEFLTNCPTSLDKKLLCEQFLTKRTKVLVVDFLAVRCNVLKLTSILLPSFISRLKEYQAHYNVFLSMLERFDPIASTT